MRSASVNYDESGVAGVQEFLTFFICRDAMPRVSGIAVFFRQLSTEAQINRYFTAKGKPLV